MGEGRVGNMMVRGRETGGKEGNGIGEREERENEKRERGEHRWKGKGSWLG
jgi:hypothetical protein